MLRSRPHLARSTKYDIGFTARIRQRSARSPRIDDRGQKNQAWRKSWYMSRKSLKIAQVETKGDARQNPATRITENGK
jgi:hypothetical protein